MSSDETTLPQEGHNPSAATLLVGSRVGGANGSTDSGMSHVQSGGSCARRDNPESKTCKTGRRQARKKGIQMEELPLLQVDGLPDGGEKERKVEAT